MNTGKLKMSISIASRKAKGRNLQKDVVQRISDLTGIECGKDQLIESRQMGQSGTDCILIGEAKRLFNFAVECKSCENWTPNSYIQQSKANLEGFDNWLVVMKKSRKKPVVLMDTKLFKILTKKTSLKLSILFHHIIRKNNWNLQSEVEYILEKMKKRKGDWAIKCGPKMGYTVVSIDFFFKLYGSSMMFKSLKR